MADSSWRARGTVGSSIPRLPAVLPGPGIPLGLFHPLPDRDLGQVEVLRDLPHRPVTLLAELNDLGLELRTGRAAAPGLLPMLSMIGHPSEDKP